MRSGSTLSAGVAVWKKPPRPASGRWLRYALGACGALLCASYLAGALLMALLHADPREATPLTWLRYGYYYADQNDIRRRIEVSGALAFGILALGTGAALLPRRRALHGDARFATPVRDRRGGTLGI